MSEDEAKITSEEEQEDEPETKTPKGKRGRPAKGAAKTPTPKKAGKKDVDEEQSELQQQEAEGEEVGLPSPAVQIVVSDVDCFQSEPEPQQFQFKAPLPVECFQQQEQTQQQQPGFPVAQPPDPFQFPHAPQSVEESDFQPSQNFQFAASDFDFLLSKGNNSPNSGQADEVPRDSLLLRFDPLLKAPVVARLSSTKEEEPQEELGFGGGAGLVELYQQPLVQTAPAVEDEEHNQQQPQQQPQQLVYDYHNEQQDVGEGVLLTALEASGFIAVSPTPSNRSSTGSTAANNNIVDMDEGGEECKTQQHCADEEAEDEKMSVDNTMILDYGGGDGGANNITTDRNMSFAETDQDYNGGGVGGAELDKKSKNESLKLEELQRKLAEAEQREEQLLKRITDKDKTISKMSGVVEAYERAIAELIAEKEQTTQSYEKTCEALKADSDINAQHLESLEKTFSDLHAKYERMKIITAEYKEREEELVAERNRFEESLRMQEKRYENMKGHAMTQLETANSKLSELVRNHAQEVTKLKALLKKEEIYRASVNEQLSQKARENEELVKICEELINGGAN
uniref:Transforming acidic coiled-coil-containing protein C-terminal domain-containing protein n=1 Tax=Culex tarsalis TaxID=7177 RepID=A0A1Q3EXQ6_CULTA